jgi:LmbE family N-acetylglucosaminyl deacetylase
MSIDTSTPTRALFIVAHPDDIEFGCAGTAAKWVQQGAEVAYLLVTSGDAGIDKPGMTRAEAAITREAEQRAAAAAVGVREVIFLREPDGLVVNTLDLRKRLVREIRRFRPEVVVTMDPTRVFVGTEYINHPDHRAVATAAIDAIFPAAGQPQVFEELAVEGLAPHKVRKVFVIGFSEGETVVDITETFDLKITALRLHISQMGDWNPEERLREWAADIGKPHGVALAEGYRVMTLVNDEDWAKRVGTAEGPAAADEAAAIVEPEAATEAPAG